MSDYGCYNVSEPPIDAPRDPMYKSEREVSKVHLNCIILQVPHRAFFSPHIYHVVGHNLRILGICLEDQLPSPAHRVYTCFLPQVRFRLLPSDMIFETTPAICLASGDLTWKET